MSGGPTWRELGGAACVFATLTLALFADPLFRPEWIASHPWGDGPRYFVPMRTFASAELASGHVPLWNPHSFSGTTFIGASQTALFYPVQLLYQLFPVGTAFDLELALDVFGMGLLTFIWLRAQGPGPVASAFAALAVTCGATFFGRIQAGQLSVIGGYLWLPLLLRSIDVLAQRAAPAWAATGAVSIALMILAGHPPTVLMNGVATLCYVAVRWPGSPRRTQLALTLVGMAVVALALSAVQLFPGIEAALDSGRYTARSYGFAASFSLPPEGLLTLFAPGFFGDPLFWNGRSWFWDVSAYMGGVALVLALHGAAGPSHPMRRVSIVLSVAFTLLALGGYTPLYHLVYTLLPGFGLIRAPSKFLFHAALFASPLVALGTDRVLRGETRGSARWALVFAALLFALATWVAVAPLGSPGSFLTWLDSLPRELTIWLDPARRPEWTSVAFTSALLSGAGFALAAAFLRWGSRTAVWLLLLSGTAELVVFAFELRSASPVRLDVMRRPGAHAAYDLAGEDRVLEANFNATNIATLVGGFSLWGYDPVISSRYARFIAYTQDLPIERLNNVGGRVKMRFHPLFSALRCRWVSLHNAANEVPNALPRFRIVRNVRIVDGEDAVYETFDSKDFDPLTEVVLEKSPGIAIRADATASREDAIEVLGASTDLVELEVSLAEPGLLVIGDAYDEDWVARGDSGGVQTGYEILPANAVLRAIPLAAGHHHLEMAYRPTSFTVGAGLSAVSLTAFLGFASAAALRGRRRFARLSDAETVISARVSP